MKCTVVESYLTKNRVLGAAVGVGKKCTMVAPYLNKNRVLGAAFKFTVIVPLTFLALLNLLKGKV